MRGFLNIGVKSSRVFLLLQAFWILRYKDFQISAFATRGLPELRAADLLVGEWEVEIAPNHTRRGSLKHDQGREELSHGRFLLDPGIFAWVEQALDMAENCSTPSSRPRIRPGRFCLGRIPGLRPGVEQVSGRIGGWLDRGRNAPVEIWPDPRILGAVGHKPTSHTCTIWHCGPRMV